MRTAHLALALAPFVAPAFAAQTEVVLRPSDAGPDLSFGADLSLSGTGLLVGAPGDGTTVPGRAYVFRHTAGGWAEEATLQMPGPAGFEGFGKAVRLEGDLAFVGAPDHVHSSGNASGAVYLFQRTAGAWGAPTLLLPSDAATTTRFGHDIAAVPGRLLVASKFRAYVFEPAAGVWTETAILAGDTSVLRDVDLHGERAVLGHGHAYVFDHDGTGATGWSSGVQLDTEGSLATPLSQLVALGEDRLAAVLVANPCQFGEVHGYEWLGSEWRKSTATPQFGSSTTTAEIDGDRAAVGGSNWLTIFRDLPSGGWVEEETRLAGVPGMLIQDGGADIAGNLGALGTPWDDADGASSGSVWIWELSPFTGLPASMTVESGGTQELELRRGAFEAFTVYWIFGSATGTSPGMTVDGLPFPLNLDAYYLFLVLNPNTVVNPTIGLLDETGRAPSAITFPPLDPMLAGLTLHHAFLTFDLIGGPVVDFVSNPVPLRLSTEAELPPEDFEALAPGWTFGLDSFGAAGWDIVEDGACGAVTRMAAYTSPAPACGGDLNLGVTLKNARLTSAPFRLGEVGDYELRLRSIRTPEVEPRIRLFVDAPMPAYFEIAFPSDFDDGGSLESLSFRIPGIEYAIGENATIELVAEGKFTGNSPAGWWVDDVEIVKLR